MSIKERFERDKECTIQYYVSELLHLEYNTILCFRITSFRS